jgi:cytidine deaminase
MEVRKEFGFHYHEYSGISELPETLAKLAQKAKEALKSSHSPYSHFAVGAAVLLDNGEVILGSNQENGAYPSGICAERVALFYAGSAYPNLAVTAIAVAANYKGKPTIEPISPCGGCRQVMIETRNMSNCAIKLVMIGEKKVTVVDDVAYLLPFSFSSIDDAIKE